MIDVEKQLQAARRGLLDLTMRNKLLNFRPAKQRTIKVVDEIPREIYNILVLEGKSMGFLPDKAAGKNNSPGLFDVPDDNEAKEESNLWKKIADDELAEHYDNSLQTSLDKETLQKRLFYISQESHSILEELGYSTLYLAIGFLEWYESPDSLESEKAPLLLIPVELKRIKVNSSFKLSWNEDDITANISLQAELQEQGITIPDFEMPEDKSNIDDYFQRVIRNIQAKPKWRVLADIYLGFFSFTKFIMYRDLDCFHSQMMSG